MLLLLIRSFLFDSDETNWFIGTDILPNKNIPMLFDSIDGKCLRDSKNSFYNIDEACAVVEYVKRILNYVSLKGRKILQTDIGIFISS